MDGNRHIYNYTNVWGSDYDIWNKIKIATHSFHREHLTKLGNLLSRLTGVGYSFSKSKYDWDHKRWLHFYWTKENQRVFIFTLGEWREVTLKYEWNWRQPFSVHRWYGYSQWKGKSEFYHVGRYAHYIWEKHWVRQSTHVTDMDKLFDPYEDYLESGGHNE